MEAPACGFARPRRPASASPDRRKVLRCRDIALDRGEPACFYYGRPEKLSGLFVADCPGMGVILFSGRLLRQFEAAGEIAEDRGDVAMVPSQQRAMAGHAKAVERFSFAVASGRNRCNIRR